MRATARSALATFRVGRRPGPRRIGTRRTVVPPRAGDPYRAIVKCQGMVMPTCACALALTGQPLLAEVIFDVHRLLGLVEDEALELAADERHRDLDGPVDVVHGAAATRLQTRRAGGGHGHALGLDAPRARPGAAGRGLPLLDLLEDIGRLEHLLREAGKVGLHGALGHDA